MEKQKTSIFIALVLVLLIIAGVVAWITHDSTDEPDTDNTPVPAASSDVTVTTAEPEESEAPATAAPTATPAPTPTPKPDTPSGDGRVSKSGSFTSDTGTNLNVVVEWKVVSVDEHTLSVTVDVYVQSFSLEIGQRTGNTVTINGKAYSFVSSPVTHTNNNSLQRTLVTTVTTEVSAEAGSTVTIPIAVDWNFRGTYSGTEIEHVTAESSVSISA